MPENINTTNARHSFVYRVSSVEVVVLVGGQISCEDRVWPRGSGVPLCFSGQRRRAQLLFVFSALRKKNTLLEPVTGKGRKDET